MGCKYALLCVCVRKARCWGLVMKGQMLQGQVMIHRKLWRWSKGPPMWDSSILYLNPGIKGNPSAFESLCILQITLFGLSKECSSFTVLEVAFLSLVEDFCSVFFPGLAHCKAEESGPGRDECTIIDQLLNQSLY